MTEFDGPGGDDELFPASRPSSVLGAQGGFRGGRFLAITAAIAAGGGVAVGSYYMGKRAGEQSATPNDVEPVQVVEPSTVEPDVPAEVPTPDVPPVEPKLDLGGPPKLDVPEPWSDDPNAIVDDAPGPEVETPSWERDALPSVQ